ncbi:hypothetical protein [Stenotrophomonas rhizophila]|uniref:Guanylate cyclase domain-containing protein n=1 Tax=Stenotrophomonas rhizophila TaxID=216778 RepID=A0AAW5PKZ1_9GAMM|nr:hypothetical protein [Stenotrophomonas rhizophila]MCS4281108.1 hypothetical protein [Stenotrophomonas rhizophila]
MAYKKTVVAFLDVLGTKENKDFDSKLRIHKAFHESMKEYQARDRPEASYFRKVHTFSDCAYIFHGTRSGDSNDSTSEDHLVQTALFNTSLTTLRLLSEGFLVRGGVSLSDAYQDDLGFFGPAVEEAYELESKRAIFPRIILAHELGKRAKEFSEAAHKALLSETNPSLCGLPQRSFLPKLVHHSDDGYYVNPLYLLEMESLVILGGKEYTHASLTASILRSIEINLERQSSDSPVRVKLEWMKEFTARSRSSLLGNSQSIAVERLP